MPSSWRRLAAIVLLLLLLTIPAKAGSKSAACDPQRATDDLIERNRRTIGSLFERGGGSSLAESGLLDEPEREKGSDRAERGSQRGGVEKKSLLNMPAPDIFRDPDSSQDLESSKPHVRTKRIASPLNSAPKSSRSLTDQRRMAHSRMFRRFSPEEANPADENEAEYSEALEDESVDFPGAVLDDEVNSGKRNHLDDVYEEIEPPGQGMKSPPDRGEPGLRRKREQESEADCGDGEETADYIYEDEAEALPSAGDSSSRAAQLQAGERLDRRDSGAQRISGIRNKAANSKLNSKPRVVEEDFLHSSDQEAVAPKIQETAPAIAAARAAPKKLSQAKIGVSASQKQHKPKEKTKKKPPRKKSKVTGKASSSSKAKQQHQQAKKSAEAKNAECCKAEAVDEKSKSLVVKVLPLSASKSQASEESGGHVDQTALAIVEMRDLLSKLLVKVEDLHTIVASLRPVNRSNRLQLADETELTRSNFLPDSRGRLRSASSSASCQSHQQRRRVWSPWTSWSGCSVSCGLGTESRSRRCLDGCEARENLIEERACLYPDCPAKFLGMFR